MPAVTAVAGNWSVVDTQAGGAWEPYTRVSDANNRIVCRNADGATTADMAYIAQQAAIEYERALNAGELDEEERSNCVCPPEVDSPNAKSLASSLVSEEELK